MLRIDILTAYKERHSLYFSDFSYSFVTLNYELRITNYELRIKNVSIVRCEQIRLLIKPFCFFVSPLQGDFIIGNAFSRGCASLHPGL